MYQILTFPLSEVAQFLPSSIELDQSSEKWLLPIHNLVLTLAGTLFSNIVYLLDSNIN